MKFKRERWELQQMQSLPLRHKIEMTARRIESWYEYYDSCNTGTGRTKKDSRTN